MKKMMIMLLFALFAGVAVQAQTTDGRTDENDEITNVPVSRQTATIVSVLRAGLQVRLEDGTTHDLIGYPPDPVRGARIEVTVIEPEGLQGRTIPKGRNRIVVAQGYDADKHPVPGFVGKGLYK